MQRAKQTQRLIAILMLMSASVAQAQQLDGSQAALIAEALNVKVAFAHAGSSPDKSRAQVYVGSQPDAPFLRDITFLVNDSEPVRYEFSDTEARAIQRSARYRVALPGIHEGANQLRVDFHATDEIDKGIGVFKHGQFTKRFSVAAAAPTVDLTLTKGNFVSDAAFDISIIESVAVSSSDELGAIDLMMANGAYFQAASALMRLSTNGSAAQSSEEINKRLGACRVALGLQAAPTPSGSDPATARLNQALALINRGNGAEASAALDLLGRDEAKDSSALTIRDQANLVLAYYYLDHGLGPEAIPVFQRIRSPGPYANAGLLGLGWALLAPPHRDGAANPVTTPRYPTIVTPRLTADIIALHQNQPPRVPSPDKDQQTALRKAMIPWTELIGRDPTDPAVQEGMLAIAWTLYHFGAYAQAQDDYTRSAEQLEKIRGWYDNAVTHVRSGGMTSVIAAQDSASSSGWPHTSVTLTPSHAHWWHGDTPETPKAVADTFYFERLLLNDDFAAALQRYRNLIEADTAAREMATTDSGSDLHNRLSAAIASEGAQLQSIALTELSSQKQKLEKYLIEARFALATIYDRPEMASAQ